MTKRDDLQRRYEAAAHAVQAGVGMELSDDERHQGADLPHQDASKRLLERYISRRKEPLDGGYYAIRKRTQTLTGSARTDAD